RRLRPPRLPSPEASRSTIGASAAATSASAKAKASVATINRSGNEVGGGAPNTASQTRVKVSPSRANQPTVSEPGAWASTPVKSTRPCVGRIPNRPQKLAGTRTEPPVSVPSAKLHTPAATTDAEPEDEPPGTLSCAAGLSGVPVNGFSP